MIAPYTPAVHDDGYFGEDVAARYDDPDDEMSEQEPIESVVDVLAGLAGGGRALEFAIGTGRIALPLAARGVPVAGIDLSRAMVARLRAKPGGDAIEVVIGDIATTRVDGSFSLVYLVFNTLGNLRTQQEQVACFRNAARHLRPGGRFVIELGVPAIRRLPPGQLAVPFDVGERHLGFDTYDLATQAGISHHYWPDEDGQVRYGVHHYRYVWPAECDLMAQLAGLELEQRLADWDGSPFTSDSESHVSVWRKP